MTMPKEIAKYAFDDLDRRLIAQLRGDGRAPLSKLAQVLRVSRGTVQNRLEHFLDSANPKLERARADFDLTHMIKGNAIFELPIGKGHRLNWKAISPVLSGWSMTICTCISGSRVRISGCTSPTHPRKGSRQPPSQSN